jgi:histidinol-phosphate/aromatic aminotransferase/cobyric acid decarboxylase-like protein
MQGVILAAGMGKRLKELTADNTKCMIRVNGITLIERMLRQLDAIHLDRIIIVIGYQGQKLVEYINTLQIATPILYITNDIYDKTNNIYSLALAKQFLLEDDTLLLESDIIFEDTILSCLVDDPRETLALVDKYESWMDGTVIKIDENDHIQAFIPGSKFQFQEIKDYYKTVNIYKFGKNFSRSHYVPFLDAYTQALGRNEYYEQVLRIITMLDIPVIQAKRLNGQKWYEIDDIQDLDIASSIFAPEEDEKLSLMQKRYGGYWRYPKLLDFCYLVNPYYPPQKLLDEIKANFETLICQYPSGMEVNALLAAKNFGVHKEQILVGNGAAELIKVLMDQLGGKVGFVRPTFEEYPNRYDKKNSVCYYPDIPDFHYTADDLIHYFSDKDINSLVMINPDNPSGNYITIGNIKRLIKWCEEKSIRLILDESFADFADEAENSLIVEETLKNHPSLIVLKSISKSYGVPGLRLGVLASGDLQLIAALKKNVSIWNINSFAEFYMQISGKYEKSYFAAMQKFRETRRMFIEQLMGIPHVRIIPTQANFVMLELLDGINAKDLTTHLLNDESILIKDLGSKTPNGQYIRIAIRKEEDNARLRESLRAYLD